MALLIIGTLTKHDDTKDEGATGKSTTTMVKPTTTEASTTSRASTTTSQLEATTTTSAPVTTTTRPRVTGTAAPKLPAGCVAITGPVGETIGDGVVIAGAATAPPNPYGEHQPRWYYSTATGATWVSAIPTDGNGGGLTLPINDKARSASESGVDVPPDSPAFDHIGDAYPAAAKSRECATAR